MKLRLLLVAAVCWFTAEVAVAQKEFGFDNRKASGQPYLQPLESVGRFKVAPEFEVKLFAGEPDCINPVAFSIDERGRVWVLECFEYPSRTPKGKAPRDRIVILEDTNGDGSCDKRTIFAEGKDFPVSPERAAAGLGAFDLATGLELGNGGVYVGAPPHLYFIENHNDKPGKFEVLATGFGAQDTHETLNTFQWGPDGWLYGLHGVFTQSNVKSLDGEELRMNAAVWRFHPIRKKFEVFAEGTSNPWGMDWRNQDGQLILACCVIPHLYHIVDGGIYRRQAGASYNPYAYGYIKEISDHTFHKESGWAHAGLLALDAPHIPEKYRNSVIFGSIHGCSLKQNILQPLGSSYLATRGDDFLQSGDKNFRPINLKWGPHGDIYLIDWHDQNPCHQAAPDSWDYERGRVYRIQLKDRPTGYTSDLGQESLESLVRIALTSNDPYGYRTALRLLSNKPKADIKQAIATSGVNIEKHALRLLQLLAYQGDYRYTPNEPLPSLGQQNPATQAFLVKLIGQAQGLDESVVELLTSLAMKSNEPTVRREIASVAISLADRFTVAPVLHALMAQEADADDLLIPKLTWVAYEKVLAKKADEGATNPKAKELAWLGEQASKNRFVRDEIVPKTMRRLAATGQPNDIDLCLQFVERCNDLNVREKALEGLSIALAGQTLPLPKAWPTLHAKLKQEPSLAESVNKLQIVFRDLKAIEALETLATDRGQPTEQRMMALRQLAEAKQADVSKLLAILNNDLEAESLRIEAVRTLANANQTNLAEELLKQWSIYPAGVQRELVNLLASRKNWAFEMMQAMRNERLDRQLVGDNVILRIRAFNDADLNQLIERAWGRTQATPAELQKQIDEMRTELNQGSASFVRGKAVFEAHCAKCHKFDGRGQEVGPPIDGAARDIEYLLANIMDPNRVIGAPYFQRLVATLDGKIEQGILVEEDERFLTLKVEQGILKKIAKDDIDGEVRVIEKSMMPEGLAYSMTTQNFRDLVAYTMASPYLTKVQVNGLEVSVPVVGRIPLKDAERATITAKFSVKKHLATQLQLGVFGPYEVLLDGQKLVNGESTDDRPDSISVPVEITPGEHELTVVLSAPKKQAWLRFLDPDRQLDYPK